MAVGNLESKYDEANINLIALIQTLKEGDGFDNQTFDYARKVLASVKADIERGDQSKTVQRKMRQAEQYALKILTAEVKSLE